MGFKVLASLCFVAVLVYSAQAGPSVSSRCPPPSKVYDRKPCYEDYDCKKGKVCCPNSSNMRSCTEPAYGAAAGNAPDKYQSGGSGSRNCGNVKCMPYQKCIKDPRTGQLKCVTA